MPTGDVFPSHYLHIRSCLPIRTATWAGDARRLHMLQRQLLKSPDNRPLMSISIPRLAKSNGYSAPRLPKLAKLDYSISDTTVEKFDNLLRAVVVVFKKSLRIG